MLQLIEIDGDKLSLNFHPGQQKAWDSEARIVAVIAGAQSGKALALGTPIPTPRGFVPMADIAVGDQVFDEFGEVCQVTGVSEVMYGHECFRLTFDDGSSVVADGDHEWVVQSRRDRKQAKRYGRSFVPDRYDDGLFEDILSKYYRKMTTKDMIPDLVIGKNCSNYSIDNFDRINSPGCDLPIPPYTLGAWLGDGTTLTSSITTADPEILENINADGFRIGKARSPSGRASTYTIGGTGKIGGTLESHRNELTCALREANILGNKHIPPQYLFASASQRLALLQGLMDTDGCCCDGECEYVTILPELAKSVLILVRSLGIKARMKTKIPKIYGKECSLAYRILFTTSKPVFRLKRKLAKLSKETRPDVGRRFIDKIEPVESVPVKCISVSSGSRLYLCGESFIATHNSVFGPPWLWKEICLRGPGDYGVICPTKTLAKNKVIPTLVDFFQKKMRLGDFNVSDSTFRFSSEGSFRTFGKETHLETTIAVKQATDPESLESMTWKAAWCDEAGQNKFKIGSWEAIQRRLAVYQGRILISSTPYNLGWLKQKIWDKWKQGDKSIECIRFDSTENPAFPQEEFERARQNLPEWKFNMFYRGIFSRPAGLIYDSFDETKHKVKRFTIPVGWQRYVGVDFGGIHTAAVFYAQCPDTKRYYAYREYFPKASRTSKEHVEAILKGEPTRPTAIGGAKSESQWRVDFGAAGLYVGEPACTEVDVGISRVWGAHKRDEIYVFDDLEYYLNEKMTYSYELDDAGEPIEEIEDKETFHLMDAERYIVGYLCRGVKDYTIRGGGGNVVHKAPQGVFGRRG